MIVERAATPCQVLERPPHPSSPSSSWRAALRTEAHKQRVCLGKQGPAAPTSRVCVATITGALHPAWRHGQLSPNTCEGHLQAGKVGAKGRTARPARAGGRRRRQRWRHDVAVADATPNTLIACPIASSIQGRPCQQSAWPAGLTGTQRAAGSACKGSCFTEQVRCCIASKNADKSSADGSWWGSTCIEVCCGKLRVCMHASVRKHVPGRICARSPRDQDVCGTGSRRGARQIPMHQLCNKVTSNELAAMLNCASRFR